MVLIVCTKWRPNWNQILDCVLLMYKKCAGLVYCRLRLQTTNSECWRIVCKVLDEFTKTRIVKVCHWIKLSNAIWQWVIRWRPGVSDVQVLIDRNHLGCVDLDSAWQTTTAPSISPIKDTGVFVAPDVTRGDKWKLVVFYGRGQCDLSLVTNMPHTISSLSRPN